MDLRSRSLALELLRIQLAEPPIDFPQPAVDPIQVALRCQLEQPQDAVHSLFDPPRSIALKTLDALRELPAQPVQLLASALLEGLATLADLLVEVAVGLCFKYYEQ